MAVAEGNVGLAFAFVIGAGLCTTLGAALAFCVKITDLRMLAASLGVSAGVMIYVSFGEIFMIKGVAAFAAADCGDDGPGSVDCLYNDDEALRYATFCFFGGIILTSLLDKLVHLIADAAKKRGVKPGGCPCAVDPAALASMSEQMNAPSAESQGASAGHGHGHGHGQDSGHGHDAGHSHGGEPCSGHGHGGGADTSSTEAASAPKPADPLKDKAVEDGLSSDEIQIRDKMAAAHGIDDEELTQMGLMTGLAIALHNFPEGLATFVATLADAKVGGAIAVAIALHNIPEGVCVAMPVYYATGSRWKGFWWSFLSGISEPIGGLLGYTVLYGNAMSELAYGVLFCIVAGMMVYICVKELIPTALKYDPQDKYVSNCVFLGMAGMASSLLMFAV